MREFVINDISTYIILTVFCLLLIIYFIAGLLRHFGQEGRKPKRELVVMFYVYAIVLLVDILWAVVQKNWPGNITLNYVINVIYFVLNILALACWFLHAETERNGLVSKKLYVKIISLLPLACSVGVIVMTPLNKLLFCVNESGQYVRGDYFAWIEALECIYYIVEVILVIVARSRKIYANNRHQMLGAAIFPLPIIVTGLLQYSTGIAFFTLGVTFSLGTIYMLSIISVEKKYVDLQRSLSTDFDLIYTVNVDNNTAEVVRVNEKLDVLKGVKKYDGYDKAVDFIITKLIAEEDREEARKIFDKQSIFNQLEEKSSFQNAFRLADSTETKYISTRFVQLKHNGSNGRFFVFGIVIDDDSAQIREELKKLVVESEYSKRQNQLLSVISAISHEYNSLVIENFSNDAVEIMRINREGDSGRLFEKEICDSYEDRVKFFADNFVDERDKEMYMESLQKDVILAHIANEGLHSVRFRCVDEKGNSYWYEAIAVKNEQDSTGQSMIMGFRNIDSIVRQEEERQEAFKVIRGKAIVDNLGKDYECINYIHIKSDKKDDTVEIYRLSDSFCEKIPGWENELKFRERINLLIENIVSKEERKNVFDKTRREVVVAQLENDKAYYVDFTAETGDDEDKTMYQIKFTAEKGEEGKLIGIVVGIRDVTEEVKSREEYMELEKNYTRQRYFTNLFVDAYIVSAYINLISKKYEIYSSFVQNTDAYLENKNIMDVIDMYIRNAVHEEDRQLFYDVTREEYVRERLKQEDHFAVVFRNIEGEKPVYYNLRIIKGHDDNHVAMGIIDVNSEYEKEKQVERQLAQANNMKTTFLFNMSHDIRTPMNAIMGYASLAKKHSINPERVEDYIDKINISGEHLLSLINEVLDMSRIEAGKIDSKMKALNIYDLVDKIITICSENAMKKDITLVCDKDQIRNLSVFADELHINQVLMNVLSNAIKYTEAGGSVKLTVLEEPALERSHVCVNLIVEDSGIGMEKEYVDHIFDPFSRERNTTFAGVEGTGLGMAIVKKLVDFMGGDIAIESEIGKGTKVTIKINVRVLDYMPANDNDMPSTFIGFDGKKVLLVEDNEMNREIAREILEDEYMNVFEASNGQKAYEMIKEKGINYFDFVLMDIQMPILNGYEATKKIRELEDGYTLPIIALSANAFEDDKNKSLDAGMDDHIAKPIKVEELFGAMVNYM